MAQFKAGLAMVHRPFPLHPSDMHDPDLHAQGSCMLVRYLRGKDCLFLAVYIVNSNSIVVCFLMAVILVVIIT